MTPADFDPDWWEQHYQRTDTAPVGRPSPYVLSELAALTPGWALDVGCGTGADALWLAAQGWQVTALDISPTAVERARSNAAPWPEEVGERISWLVADAMTWPANREFDVVVSQYVHPEASFGAFVRRVAGLVAPGGTLLIVGHDHADSHSREHAPRDASVAGAAVTDELAAQHWQTELVETRHRTVSHDGRELIMHDTVVKARRRC